MKTKYLLLILSFTTFFAAAQPADVPKTSISNGLIKAEVLLPDSIKGYYRATRFDWSGAVSSLDYKGHSFYGKWFGNYNPKENDAILGPAEVFFPVGYEEAKAGETFVNIGVGALRKPVEEKYNQFRTYDIVDYGKWTITARKDEVVFKHILCTPDGYAYEYTKTLKLVKGQARMVISHSLKNTGTKTMETLTYNHNFPVIDQEPTGPNIKVTFAKPVTAEGDGWDVLAKLRGHELTFLKQLSGREFVQTVHVNGLGDTPADYDFKIENLKTGAGIHITGDHPMEKVVFWANPSTYCPEPYVKINVAPGETMHWIINYDYYTFEAKK
ncbi:hypothetical protein MUY27_02080 [Mucilaginibacter sp. RS28]|uniref:Aldose 1-epimerase n=1 Tax=Mucilaginibacter straminoryzae TaxID=2932774 RepID=A0A9X1WZN8_9SPHI|nr:hypothetical protein [Mucilaginibacter straminoryzae]MCJ8208479.1 hypothetical protein [Mucilaginibacter straminoryzae]